MAFFLLLRSDGRLVGAHKVYTYVRTHLHNIMFFSKPIHLRPTQANAIKRSEWYDADGAAAASAPAAKQDDGAESSRLRYAWLKYNYFSAFTFWLAFSVARTGMRGQQFAKVFLVWHISSGLSFSYSLSLSISLFFRVGLGDGGLMCITVYIIPASTQIRYAHL